MNAALAKEGIHAVGDDMVGWRMSLCIRDLKQSAGMYNSPGHNMSRYTQGKLHSEDRTSKHQQVIHSKRKPRCNRNCNFRFTSLGTTSHSPVRSDTRPVKQKAGKVVGIPVFGWANESVGRLHVSIPLTSVARFSTNVTRKLKNVPPFLFFIPITSRLPNKRPQSPCKSLSQQPVPPPQSTAAHY